MHKQTLRELSKFASGLVVADFLCGLWLYSTGLLPRTVLGMNITAHGVIIGMVFDVLAFAFLVHFGWRMQNRQRTRGEHNFHLLAGTIFTLVALVHLSRLVFGWQFTIGSWNMPYWLNGLGAIIAAFLAYASFALS